MRFLVYFCSLLAALAVADIQAGGASPSQPRNDSGQTACHDTSGEEIACSLPGYLGQDGLYGRDAAAGDGVLPKTGGGSGGFDFTKIANNGNPLPEGAALGPDPEDWACTQDNVTGLIWEIKISDVSSPRHYQWFYGWYSEDHEHNGGDPGFPVGFSLACNFTLECNTQAYIDYINGLALCGRTDWRLPGLEELQGIVNFGSSFFTGGAMDQVYFADGGGYSGWGGAWTGDTAHEPSAHHAWMVNFDDGHAEGAPKGAILPVRLVAGDLNESEGEMPFCMGLENAQIRPSTAGAFTIDDQLVHDARTGLTWTRCLLGQSLEGGDGGGGQCDGGPESFTWQQALQAVKARNAEHYLGHDDWRLPGMKELASLKERRCAMPMLDGIAFPQPAMEPFWTSTTSTYAPHLAFAIGFEFGHQLSMLKTSSLPHVKLVRGGGPFDDYRGPVAYSVGGQVFEMLGEGLALRLEADGQTEFLQVDANGDFVFTSGLDEGTPYTVSVEQPPVPFQECTVENGTGLVSTSDVTDVEVICAEPDPPRIEVTPEALDVTVLQASTASADLVITNTGGGILHWDIQTAFPNSAGITGLVDCEAQPGIIIHDDGTAESGYTGNPNWNDPIMIVDRFSPESYPASISSVCLGFAGASGATSLTFEIVVFADNGPAGTPGTELGALAVTAAGIPAFPVATPTWFSYDISSLFTTIEAGSVYVGVRWQPAIPQVFLLADETNDRPAGYAGGYYWHPALGAGGQWIPTQQQFPEYRAMFIRAVEDGPQTPPAGCDNPNAIPWLSITPNAGQTNADDDSVVEVVMEPGGMTVGEYQALLCIGSNDPDQPLVTVPVTMTVAGPHTGILEVSPAEIDFGAVQTGATGSDTLTVSNAGDPGAPALELGAIEVVTGMPEFEITGGDCQTGLLLAQGDECTVEITFAPVAEGTFTGEAVITAVDGQSETVTLVGSGAEAVPPPDPIFNDRFETFEP